MFFHKSTPIVGGYLIELAVAFIMGAAFTAVVTSFSDMLLGFIGLLFDEPDFSEVTLAGVTVGLFLNALLAFLIMAFVVYFFVVVPYTKAKEKFFPTPEPDGTPEDIALLKEIRDLLARNSNP